MKEEVYQTQIEMTYSEYKKMCWALKRKKAMAVSAVVSAFLLSGGLFFRKSGDAMTGMFFLVMAFVYPLLVFGLYSRMIHKNFYSQKAVKGARVDYQFYRDRVMLQTPVSKSEIRYDLFYRVMETKTNFYLLTGENQSLAVKKENCSGELLTLLKGLKSRNQFH